MPKISLTKSGLQKERQKLELYKKLLPSLELKRMQLRGEYARAKLARENFKQNAESAAAEIMQKIPMLANREVSLSGMVQIEGIVIEEKNMVGVKIPHLKDITFSNTLYSLLGTPSWVDAALSFVKKGVEAKVKLQIMDKSLDVLARAVKRMTQRVNLFEKVLIPLCKKNIQKIQVAIGDSERSAVIRSKLAKAHHKLEGEK